MHPMGEITPETRYIVQPTYGAFCVIDRVSGNKVAAFDARESAEAEAARLNTNGGPRYRKDAE